MSFSVCTMGVGHEPTMVSNWEHISVGKYVRLTDVGKYGRVVHISTYTKRKEGRPLTHKNQCVLPLKGWENC